MKVKIPVVWLLAINTTLVMLTVIFGNFWWLNHGKKLDHDIKVISSASMLSKKSEQQLIDHLLPLKSFMADSRYQSKLFIAELELVQIDPLRDYMLIREFSGRFQELQKQIDKVWPATLAPDSKVNFQANIDIIHEIALEVLDSYSPNQLLLFVEESKLTLDELLIVITEIESEIDRLFAQEKNTNIQNRQNLSSQALALHQDISGAQDQMILYIMLMFLIILLCQVVFFRLLKQRLSGLGQVIQQITSSGDLTQRVQDNNPKDLLGHIGAIFNSMLTRLQTSQLALESAKERAEAATQEKSNFLASMSHELRTPLHAVTGLLHLMKMQPLTEKVSSYIDKTETAVDALLHIINDVLDFSKIAENKLQLENTPFALHPAMEQLVDLFSSQFNQKGVDFTLLIAHDVPNLVCSDRLRLNQILINLLNNALKFTSSGVVSLSVSVRTVQDKQITLDFAVSDTGIGIKQDKIGSLFNAFIQADQSTTRKYGGTGLGLSISERLSKLMQGSIAVTSKLASGSTFTLTAVLQTIEPDQPFIPPLPENLIGMQLIFVCESPYQQQLLETTLKNWHLQPVAVSSVDDALLLLSQPHTEHICKLLLIDVPTAHTFDLQQTLDKITAYKQSDLAITLISHQPPEQTFSREMMVIDRPIKPSELFNMLIDGLHLPINKIAIGNSAEHAKKNQQQIQQALAGARVLIVEDVKINQQIVTEILTRAGLVTDVADNGQVALEKLQQAEFDLVLMDLQMPVMGGLEATRQIREQLKMADLPVIAITANVIKGVIDDCLESGCNGYLSKPLDPEQLWLTLEKWIKPMQRKQNAPAIRANIETQDKKFPEYLPGIDVSSALARLLGNKTLYLSLLNDFKNTFCNADQQLHNTLQNTLQSTLQNNDFSDINRQAHLLKGTAATLGLTELADAAMEMEHLAKSQMSEKAVNATASTNNNVHSKLTGQLDNLSLQLSRALSSIEQLNLYGNNAPLAISAESTTAATSRSLSRDDYQQLAPDLQELSDLIKESDSDSLDFFEPLKLKLKYADLDSFTRQLELHLSCFAFDDASDVLVKLIQHLDNKEYNARG